MSPDKRPFHVSCQDKSGPGKIHEVILVLKMKRYADKVD